MSVGTPQVLEQPGGAGGLPAPDADAPMAVVPAERTGARREPGTRGAERAGAGAGRPSAPEAAAATPAPARDAAGDGRSASRTDAAPSPPLPVRLVPRPVREIVEVVPAGVWAALAALAMIALLLSGWSALAAMRTRRLRRQREALLQEVGLLQSALLPPVPPGVPATVAYRPADGDVAGGDFYEAFALAGGRTGLILGDVAGHGREALARTTLVRYTLRAYLEAGLEPREVIKVGGEALAEHLDGGFATATVAIHEQETGRFTYACAGHHPPLVAGPAGHEPVTACAAPPLGIDEPTGMRQSSFVLTAGSSVCLFTDGLTEARVNRDVLGRGRLLRLFEGLPPGGSAENLLESVSTVADETPDDMAVCILHAPAGAPADGARVEELEVDQREVGDTLERFLRTCGVPLAEVPGLLRQAGEAARRAGTATVRVRLNDFRPGVDVLDGNVVRMAEHRRAARRGRG